MILLENGHLPRALSDEDDRPSGDGVSFAVNATCGCDFVRGTQKRDCVLFELPPDCRWIDTHLFPFQGWAPASDS